MNKLTIKMSQKTDEHIEDPISIELDCKVTSQSGTEAEIASMLLEIERFGNTGKARVHILEI